MSTTPTPELLDVLRARRARVAKQVHAAGHAALLVTDLKNVQYLTGYSGSNAAVLLRASASDLPHVIATDGRYDTQIRIETGDPADLNIHVVPSLMPVLKDAAGEDGFAVEPSLPVGEAQRLGNPDVLGGVVESARLVKDEFELQKLAAAGELADSVWREFIAKSGIRSGIREIDAAAELEYMLRKAGADCLSFDTILASGANGSKPHAGVSRDVITPGLVTVDFGIYLDGYASDQTRAVCVGKPDEQAQEIYDVVYRAQKAGEASLRPGVALKAVDAACRNLITEAGYGEFFVHSTGHGVGLDVHEAPRAASSVPEDSVLQPGMTITVEPGIYLPNRTGLRIENTYVITETGARSFNASPTELIVVD